MCINTVIVLLDPLWKAFCTEWGFTLVFWQAMIAGAMIKVYYASYNNFQMQKSSVIRGKAETIVFPIFLCWYALACVSVYIPVHSRKENYFSQNILIFLHFCFLCLGMFWIGEAFGTKTCSLVLCKVKYASLLSVPITPSQTSVRPRKLTRNRISPLNNHYQLISLP